MNRILLLLFSIIILTAAGICTAVFLHAFPDKVWNDQLQMLLTRKETLVALLILCMLSLHMIGVALSTSDDGTQAASIHEEMIVAKTPTGSICVSMAAIKHLSERVSKTIAGVRDSRASISRNDKDQLHIKLTLFVAQGIDATIVSQNVAKEIQSAIQTSLQIRDIPIDVFIKNISNERIDERRVV